MAGHRDVLHHPDKRVVTVGRQSNMSRVVRVADIAQSAKTGDILAIGHRVAHRERVIDYQCRSIVGRRIDMHRQRRLAVAMREGYHFPVHSVGTHYRLHHIVPWYQRTARPLANIHILVPS